MTQRSAIINVMTKAADKASRRLKRDFGEVENLQVSKKGPADFVSTADIRAEETLRRELRHARPGYGFLMEESGAHEGDDSQERRWIVDPLDGTKNFLHGLPHFAISIALEERGQLIAGVVYDPLRDEMYWAEKGIGAYLNDRRIRVSARTRLQECVLGSGTPYLGFGDADTWLAEARQVMTHSAGVRRWGAAALDLAYVASGRLDGFWERDLSPWDTAAGAVLVREAGGHISEIGGRDFRPESASVLAANNAIHTDLDKLLRSAKPRS